MRVVVILALAGCQAVFGLDAPKRLGIDAAPPDATCLWSFTPGEFEPCAIASPTRSIAITDVMELDSDNGTLNGKSLPYTLVGEVAVVSVNDLEIATGATLRVVGSHPLVIAAFGAITIEGTVDVSSPWDAPRLGAGANSPACGSSTGTMGVDGNNGGGGGGGGGAFGGAGGAGGKGGSGISAPAPGGLVRAVPARLEGGCAGGTGGTNAGGTGIPGFSGNGGGAIALVARDRLLIPGRIHAGGGGGGGGSTNQAGGGGGGSGGMIALEAAILELTSTAVLAANGGQGGGGCQNATAGPGTDGQLALTSTPISNNEGAGTAGGAGGAGASNAGASAANATDGAGGGGGGVGYIVYTAHDGALIDTDLVSSPLLVAR